MSGNLFGTDGIRGTANQYPLTPEMGVRIGRAAARFFADNGGPGPIVLGQDTRISGDMLVQSIAAGICAMGIDVGLAGVFTTPGVAFLTSALEAKAGVMVSASHNPFFDNGIKFFNSNGCKLQEAEEARLEMLIRDDTGLMPDTGVFQETGRCRGTVEPLRCYVQFLKGTAPRPRFLEGRSIVLDCANGGAYRIAPRVFAELGADVDVLFASPDGRNINDGCGSQHPQALCRRVRETGADFGFAFDGDGDRLVAVDHNGHPLTGDQILAVCAGYLKQTGALQANTVVTTVMSNMGLKKTLEELGIRHEMTAVGDRQVLMKMLDTGAVLGGEDSGHLIFRQYHCTGDGILAALQLINAVQAQHKTLAELAARMPVFPQVLINVAVDRKPPIDRQPRIQAAIRTVEAHLGGNGRVLVRYSGTEPLCRVMVEGPTAAETRQHCESIARAVAEQLSAG